MTMQRGRVYRAELGDWGPKLYLVVSNNSRNRNLHTALAVRLTTSPKPDIPSIVELDKEASFEGRVVCDDIVEVYDDEVLTDLGAVSPVTMRAVEDGLRAALGFR